MPFPLKTLTVVLVTAVLWPCTATANSIAGLDSTVFGYGMTYVPPADLTGWFFNPDGPPPFSLPPDPSQPWTSPENIATLNYWLGVVSDLGADPATLEHASGTGITNLAQNGPPSAQDAGAPEPAAWELFPAGLLLIGAIEELRGRRRRRYP